MKDLTTEQKKAIDLLKLAGYTIQRSENTFSLNKDGYKLCGYSSYNYLTSDFMMGVIKLRSFNEGVKIGKQDLRRDIKNLLCIDQN